MNKSIIIALMAIFMAGCQTTDSIVDYRNNNSICYPYGLANARDNCDSISNEDELDIMLERDYD